MTEKRDWSGWGWGNLDMDKSVNENIQQVAETVAEYALDISFTMEVGDGGAELSGWSQVQGEGEDDLKFNFSDIVIKTAAAIAAHGGDDESVQRQAQRLKSELQMSINILDGVGAKREKFAKLFI